MHSRHGSNHRIAVGAKGKGPVDSLAYAGLSQCRDPFKAQFEPVSNVFEVRVEQLVTKVPWRAFDLPGHAHRLIGTQQHTVAFLPEIEISLVVYAARQAGRMVDDLVDALGQQIMMFHGLDREIQAGHVPDFTRPQTAAVYDIFGIDGAVRRGHVPRTVGSLRGRRRGRVGEVLGAVVTSGLGKGVGCPRWVKVAILIIPQRRQIMLWLDQWVAFGNFLQGNKLLLKSHVARLGPLTLEIVVPGLVGGEIETAGHMQAH